MGIEEALTHDTADDSRDKKFPYSNGVDRLLDRHSNVP
jgi:hypothetical protein